MCGSSHSEIGESWVTRAISFDSFLISHKRFALIGTSTALTKIEPSTPAATPYPIKQTLLARARARKGSMRFIRKLAPVDATPSPTNTIPASTVRFMIVLLDFGAYARLGLTAMDSEIIALEI